MDIVHEKQLKKPVRTVHLYTDTNAAADRLNNFVVDLAAEVRAGSTPITQESMGRTDPLFVMEALVSYLKNRAINSETPEKKKLSRRLLSKAMFLKRAEEDGGLYSSFEAAKEIGRSKVTVKTRKDNHKMLALDIDGEFFYPVFQFVQDPEISNDGILKGIETLLPLLKHFSDRMQYSFFMEKRTAVLNGLTPKGRTFTVAELLKEKPSPLIMEELTRLALFYGTQDAL